MKDAEVLALGDRICEFLASSGGAYSRINGEMQFNVFFALGSQQYVLKEIDNEIVYFASYWMVRPEDVEVVVERIRPLDLVHGTVMYVTEAANAGNRQDMTEMVKRLRQSAPQTKGVFWHRPVKKDRVYTFPSQKGGSNGN